MNIRGVCKMEEGEGGKFPPLPISLAGLASLIPAMRLLKPIKGLYEVRKKECFRSKFVCKTLAGGFILEEGLLKNYSRQQ